jgi:hypothetical protein
LCPEALAHPKGEVEGGGGGGCRIAASTEQNLQNTDFVDTVALKLLLDLRFSLNQPLKSTFD